MIFECIFCGAYGHNAEEIQRHELNCPLKPRGLQPIYRNGDHGVSVEQPRYMPKNKKYKKRPWIHISTEVVETLLGTALSTLQPVGPKDLPTPVHKAKREPEVVEVKDSGFVPAEWDKLNELVRS